MSGRRKVVIDVSGPSSPSGDEDDVPEISAEASESSGSASEGEDIHHSDSAYVSAIPQDGPSRRSRPTPKPTLNPRRARQQHRSHSQTMSEEPRRNTGTHAPPRPSPPSFGPYHTGPTPLAGYPYGYFPPPTRQLVPYDQSYPGPGSSQNYFTDFGNYGFPPSMLQYQYGPPPPPPSDDGARAPMAATPIETERQDVSGDPTSYKKSIAIWKPTSDRDITIHFEVDIEEDVESNLHEFLRLRRMGNFVLADQYFRESLAEYLEQLPVVSAYASMLLERGSFRELFELVDVEAFTASCTMLTAQDLNGGHADEINLLLVLHLARTSSDPNLPSAHTAIRIATNFLKSRAERVDGTFTSTEVQVLSRCLILVRWTAAGSNFAIPGDLSFVYGWKSWPRLYRTLLDENRFWDLSDVVSASVDTFGPRETCQSLLGRGSMLSDLQQFLDDWNGMEYDVSRDACLLQTLMSFGRALLRRFNGDSMLDAARDFLFDKAQSVASSIRERNPQYMKSRPYLDWMLAQEEYTRVAGQLQERRTTLKPELSSHYFQQFPGKLVWSDLLPIYAPVGSENPGWPVKSASSEGTEADNILALALRMSSELGDYRAQTLCLQELICRSREPRPLFAKLERLQLSVMGNMLGLLNTRMSKYLTAVDETSREELYKDLLELDPRLHVWRNFSHPVSEWLQRRVLHAILLSSGRSPDQTRSVAAQAAALLPYLPYGFAAAPIAASGPPRPPAGTAPLNPEAQGGFPRDTAVNGGWDAHPGQGVYPGSFAPGPDYGLPPHLQQYLYRSPPPHSPVRSPPPRSPVRTQAPRPASPASPDPRVEAMRAELEIFKSEQTKRNAEAKQRELEEKIRRDAETSFSIRMNEMKKAQEEARKEIEKAKIEAEMAARERIEAERRAEEERRKMHEEVVKRAERDAREMLEAEMKAAEERKKRDAEAFAAVEASVMARIEAAGNAEAAAKAAADTKSAEEEEWRRVVREEERLLAEIAARKQLEQEVAENARAAERAARKAAEDEEWKRTTRDELKRELEKEMRTKTDHEDEEAADGTESNQPLEQGHNAAE